MTENRPESPADHATKLTVKRRAGRGGNFPPEHSMWRPGQSGNLAGRPANAGRTVRERLNDMAMWNRAEVEAVFRDEAAPVASRAAARLWLLTFSDAETAAGHPVSLEGLEKLVSHTDGSATRREQVEVASVAKYDLTRLSDVQVEQLSELLRLARS